MGRRSDGEGAVPVIYSRDDRRRRIVVGTVGYVSPEDILQVVERQAAEGAWGYATIYDSSAGVNSPKGDDMRRLVLRIGELTALHGPRGPVALVVDSATMAKAGLAYRKMGELTGMNFQIFPTLNDAEEWLAQHHEG